MITEPLQSVGELVCLGDYLGAADALGHRWLGAGRLPERRGESDEEYGRLVMLCALLTMNLGVSRTERVQETVKDMLTTSIRLMPGQLEPKLWLGVVYFWTGEYVEAIDLANAILNEQTSDLNVEVGALLTRAISEMSLDQPERSMATLDQAAMLVDGTSPLVRGKFHLNRGVALRNLERTEAALAEYEAAAPLFEEARSARYEGAVLNNMAGIYTDQGKFIKAHVVAERAVSLFRTIRDGSHEAKAWDQIARIYIRERKYSNAVKPARNAVLLLSESGNEGWLAESLTTLGIALAGSGYDESMATLGRASELNAKLGNQSLSKRAARDLWQAIQAGHEVARELTEGFRPLEKIVVEHTLEKHNGSITPAAAELEIPRQTLDKRIRAYFPDLLKKKKTRIRRKSLFRR